MKVKVKLKRSRLKKREVCLKKEELQKKRMVRMHILGHCACKLHSLFLLFSSLAIPLHPMDCSDVVIGAARGNRFRILDYYTRDRSTPRLDSFYRGGQSLTAAVGKEENGITTIIFRKPISDGNFEHCQLC